MKNRIRNGNGFSVVYVMCLSFITLLFVMAVTDNILAVQRNAASQAYFNEVNSAAENAVQYAVATLNSAAANGTLSSVGTNLAIPATITGQAQATLTIAQLSVASGSSLIQSPIYNTQTNWAVGSGGALPLDYRLLTASATLNNYRRTLNVIVGPNPYQNGLTSSANPYFTNALTANQTLTVNGVNVAFDPAYVTSQGGSVPGTSFSNTLLSSGGANNATGPATGQQMVINGPSTGQAVFAGSINAFTSGSATASSLSLPALPPTGSPPVVIDGNVNFTNAVSGSTNANGFLLPDQANTPVPGANVFGDSVNGSTAGSVTRNSASSFATTPAPVQQASGPAQMSVSSSSGAQNTTVAAPTGSQVVDLGSMSMTSNQTLTMTPGLYIANSLNIGSSATFQINMPSSGASSAVQIFLQGNSAGAPLQLQGNVKMSGTPAASNLQFFYNGSQPLSVTVNPANPNLYGLIYAPNANVTIDTGTNSAGGFHGAVVANNLTLQGKGTFFYDPRAISPSGGIPGAAKAPGYNASTTAQSFNVLSWQEVATN